MKDPISFMHPLESDTRFTAFVNQLRRDDLTEVEVAALRSLFDELKTHLQF